MFARVHKLTTLFRGFVDVASSNALPKVSGCAILSATWYIVGLKPKNLASDLRDNRVCLEMGTLKIPKSTASQLRKCHHPFSSARFCRLGVLAQRQVLRYLGVSDGNMAEGSMRLDVNVSLRPKGETGLNTKVPAPLCCQWSPMVLFRLLFSTRNYLGVRLLRNTYGTPRLRVAE